MSNTSDYTVGWICAIATEYVAAQEFLDEEHEGPDYVSLNDNNHYTLGRVGRHNVAIAVLPDGEYGKSSAAGVATSMMHTFPNIRIGLMVGIGGGAPGQHDIRLGDVVVSSAANSGGVLGYDFGKDIQGQDFQVTGFLNQPPTLLRTAMSGLRALYERKGHQLSEAVNTILDKNKRLQKKYKQPELATDQLFKPEVTHDVSCATICRYEKSSLVLRPERDKGEDSPVIHYGLIASADRLMKNALARDRLSEKHDVLCFEMEAAGLMNQFPCLIIRGICDYSDSHKSKEWQGYAAMMAAAYAKDLLYQIAPNRLEAERRVGDILSGLREVVQDHRDIAKQQLRSQENREKKRRRQACHESFRLTTGSRGASYEWYKDRVEERVQDTCLWFLGHKSYWKWLNQESGPLLVSADPGCGKSVLAKYLIDHGLPRSSTVCYFFFKDQDQNTVRQALCALIHQLLSLKPCLIEHAMSHFDRKGQALVNSTDLLWEILQNAVKDPTAGSIIIVIDALDECADTEFVDLMRNVRRQFHRDSSGYSKLRYLLTCRPYDQILSKFQVLLEAFPNIHIPGEEESEAISQEVSRVIKYRVDQLAMERKFSTKLKRSLEQRLQNTNHRTYLWVYLVFDYLAEGNFKKTPKGITAAIASLPKSVNEAYDRILNKTNKSPIVRKSLCIILAARRPLTLSEMNIAVNVDDGMQSMDDLDLEDDEDFKGRLRSWCGLFVSIHQGCIYFLHQTAREFLLADLALPTSIPSGLRWHRCITNSQAHDVLSNICVLYLSFFNSRFVLPANWAIRVKQYLDRYSFLSYSAHNWAGHLRKANITDGAPIIPLARRLCDTGSQGFSVWFEIYSYTENIAHTRDLTDLMIASLIGLTVVAKLILKDKVQIEARDSFYSLTSLSWAALAGHEAIVELLLEKSADVKTALTLAAEEGHDAVVRLLLENGVDVNAKRERYDETALYLAAHKGHEATVELLLDHGADVNAKNGADGETPLHVAAEGNYNAIVRLLLDNGADIHSKNRKGETALSRAYHRRYKDTINLLIERGAVDETEPPKSYERRSRRQRGL